MHRSIVRCLTVLGAVFLALPVLWGAERITPSTAMNLVVSKQAPEIPAVVRQLKLIGLVEVDVTIDETGAVEKVDVVKGNPLLGRAAQECVKKWKFKPYKQGDTATKAVATLGFDFK